MPYMQHQQPPRPVYSTPQQQHQQHYIPQHLQQQQHQPHLQPAPYQNMSSPRAQFVHGPPPGSAMRPMMPIPQHQQHIQPQQQPIQQIRPAFSGGAQPAPPPPSSTPGGMPGPGGQYVLRTPSLSAAPNVSMVATNPAFRPIIMRPPGVITAGPATVIASPGLARMPVALSNMRPVFIGKWDKQERYLSIPFLFCLFGVKRLEDGRIWWTGQDKEYSRKPTLSG